MSIDLRLHNNDKFVKPDTSINSQADLATQAYINLLLTLKGSIDQDTTVGVSNIVGTSNLKNIGYVLNSQILNMMKIPYSIYNISVLNIQEAEDTLKMTVKIIFNNQEETSFTIEV